MQLVRKEFGEDGRVLTKALIALRNRLHDALELLNVTSGGKDWRALVTPPVGLS
jgi:hypothetical protein